MTPVLVERTFKLGPQSWRVDSHGNWSVLMWGWWPWSNGTPSWQWSSIDKNRVPAELLRQA